MKPQERHLSKIYDPDSNFKEENMMIDNSNELGLLHPKLQCCSHKKSIKSGAELRSLGIARSLIAY